MNLNKAIVLKQSGATVPLSTIYSFQMVGAGTGMALACPAAPQEAACGRLESCDEARARCGMRPAKRQDPARRLGDE